MLSSTIFRQTTKPSLLESTILGDAYNVNEATIRLKNFSPDDPHLTYAAAVGSFEMVESYVLDKVNRPQQGANPNVCKSHTLL